MKLTTKQNDDLAVLRGKDNEGEFVELLTEDGIWYQDCGVSRPIPGATATFPPKVKPRSKRGQRVRRWR